MAHSELIAATYNLWGFGEPWRYSAERGEPRGAVPGSPAATLRPSDGVWPRRRGLLAGLFQRLQPDIIGLQEARCHAGTSISQAEQLAHDLAYECALEPISTWDYDDHALALLSRHPIRHWQEVPSAGTEQAAMHATVGLPFGPIDVLVVHVTTRREAQLAAVEHLLDFLDALPAERPAVVLGDFNSVPDAAPIAALTRARGRKALRDAWREVNGDSPGPTMPSQAPVVRIDYLFVTPGPAVVQAWRLGDEADADGFYPSDHLGVAAAFRFGGP
jgi:endonuclease/exonuclease/phosphatase family metal-dependent hydrolase